MNKEITNWLRNFENFWKSRDIDRVLDLFTDDVIYYETPFIQLKNKEAIKNEWEIIKKQEDISLNCRVFSQEDNKYCIKWDLFYIKKGMENHLKGIYLIKLNKNGKCSEFCQYCEKKELYVQKEF